MDSFQIVQKNRFQNLYWWIFSALMLAIAYGAGVYIGKQQERKSNIDKKVLNQQLEQQRSEISELIEEKVILKQDLSLKEKTLAVLESNYKLLIKESSNLKDDIKFYQRIMKPKENNLELAVHKVHIYQALATEDNNEWLEKLMADKNKDVYVLDTLLVNYAISKKTLKGYIDVDLYDKDKKAPIKPVWYNDSGKKISKLSVKFKYYQQTSYYFVIDAKSELDHVKVNVTISNSQNKVNEIMIKENQSREFRYVGQ